MTYLRDVKGRRVAEDMLESEAPTHEERKATVRRMRVASRCKVTRAARGGAVAGHGQQRALRARHRGASARRRRGRPPRCRARAAPSVSRVPRAARVARRRPLPTHWRRAPAARSSCAALSAVARPAPDTHGPYIIFHSSAANKGSK